MYKFLIILISGLLLVGCSVDPGEAVVISNPPTPEVHTGQALGGASRTVDVDGIKANFEFHNGVWEYTLTTDLPNPCYTFTSRVGALDTELSQVVVYAEIQPPRSGVMCAELITSRELEGNFSADGDIFIQLNVSRI